MKTTSSRVAARRARAGWALVELIVAGGVAVTVFAFASAFFIHQAQVSNRLQARHEVELKAKAAAEMILQDLQQAGSRVTVNAGVANSPYLPCSSSGATRCASAPGGGAGVQDDLRVFYATSLKAARPCRRIDYVVDGGTLHRSELSAAILDCGTLVGMAPDFANAVLATNVIELDIDYLCADGSVRSAPQNCYPAGSFPRQATVRVYARSDSFSDVTADIRLTGSLPNLRY